jgi:hypothetical protein
VRQPRRTRRERCWPKTRRRSSSPSIRTAPDRSLGRVGEAPRAPRATQMHECPQPLYRCGAERRNSPASGLPGLRHSRRLLQGTCAGRGTHSTRASQARRTPQDRVQHGRPRRHQTAAGSLACGSLQAEVERRPYLLRRFSCAIHLPGANCARSREHELPRSSLRS